MYWASLNFLNAGFGSALAVQGDSCLSGNCSRGTTWIAIGAPKAKALNQTAGSVFVWDPWTYGGEVSKTNPIKIGSGTLNADYGTAITTVRRQGSGGGFAIGGPATWIIVGAAPVQSGSVDVFMNKDFGDSWNPWKRQLSKVTTGDRRPENL